MVFGLDVFARHFEGFENRYVLIGGTACELVLAEHGQSFRATKDLDIVLVAETNDAAYVSHFLDFVHGGGYQHASRAKERPQYYRFSDPAEPDYPVMLELFARRSESLAELGTHLGRVQVEDAAHSLSAILLDEDYYLLLQRGTVRARGLPVLGLEHLPVFKMKAWSALTAARARGEQVNSHDITKHKNDVFRLTAVIDPGTRVSVPPAVKRDVQGFLDGVPLSPNDLANLGIRGYSPAELRGLIADIYSG